MKSFVSMVKICAAFAALSFGITANAATLTVTSTDDDASDATTLRGAIAAAADGDTIEFASSLAGATITLTTSNGPLEYDKSLSIIGPESNPVTIDGGASAVDAGCAYKGSSRTTYLIHATGTSATTTLRNLVFTGSKMDHSNSTPDVGPAVSILGDAVINSCVWTNNGVYRSGHFSSADGGNCLRVVGNLTLENSRFIDNGARGGDNNYVLGSVILAKGANVVVRNCEISETRAWEDAFGNGSDYGALSVYSDTTSLLVENVVFEKNFATHSGGAIYIPGNSSGRFVFRNCRFANNENYSAGVRHGGAVTLDGAGEYLFEGCEFANSYSAKWGGAIRSASQSANLVFANCTFVNNTGDGWGGTVDSRGNAWFVNCTAAGNVNRCSTANASGTFFTEKCTIKILNSALVWNWTSNGTVKNDTSKYGGLEIYNSWNSWAGTAPGMKDCVSNVYDTTIAFFRDGYVSLSSLTGINRTCTLTESITSPVLADATDSATPRVVEIDRNGVLLSAGWLVKHDEYWDNIAYSKDSGSTWTALRGSVDSATTLLSADSRGASYAVVDNLPVTPVGSATVPTYTMTWDVATNGGQWSDTTTASATTSSYRGDAVVIPENPSKSGYNFVGWNTDASATTALNLTGLTATADTTYYAIFEEVSSTDAVVSWFDEDGVTPLDPASTLVAEGAKPTHDEPTKTADPQYTYAFAGWKLVGGDETIYATADLPAVTAGGTISYKAVYTPTLRSYTVVFKDADATVLSSEIYAYGTTPSEMTIPELAMKVTYEYTYTFANWDAMVSNVVGEATYTAVYSATANIIALEKGNYRYSREMTATGYDGEGTLENFPVLVRLTHGVGGFDATTVTDASEIRFADANGNMIPHEVDTWNPSGESTIWVSLPEISGTSTKFTMYWHPAGGQQTALTASRVWTQAGYLGVWHFSPATNRVYANSAQPEHYATASVAGTEGTDGVVGGYVQFPSGATTFVNDSIAWAGYTTHMTCEFWVDRQDKGDARIFGSGTSYDQGASIYMSGYISGNCMHCGQKSDLIPSTGWRHVSVNFSATTQANALADGETAYTFWRAGGYPYDGQYGCFYHNVNEGTSYADYHALSLTSHGDGGSQFLGYADEFRLRGENSTAEWMQANYDTQAPSTDFLTYGDVKMRGGFILFVR